MGAGLLIFVAIDVDGNSSIGARCQLRLRSAGAVSVCLSEFPSRPFCCPFCFALRRVRTCNCAVRSLRSFTGLVFRTCTQDQRLVAIENVAAWSRLRDRIPCFSMEYSRYLKVSNKSVSKFQLCCHPVSRHWVIITMDGVTNRKCWSGPQSRQKTRFDRGQR